MLHEANMSMVDQKQLRHWAIVQRLLLACLYHVIIYGRIIARSNLVSVATHPTCNRRGHDHQHANHTLYSGTKIAVQLIDGCVISLHKGD